MDLFLLLTALLCGLTGNARTADVRAAGVVQSRPLAAAQIGTIGLHVVRAARATPWQALAVRADGRRMAAIELQAPASPPRTMRPLAPERRRE